MVTLEAVRDLLLPGVYVRGWGLCIAVEDDGGKVLRMEAIGRAPIHLLRSSEIDGKDRSTVLGIVKGRIPPV